jgi:outer membrane immunogenic protein
MSSKTSLACAGAFAAAATFAGTAFAADLAPPPPPVPIFTWTGLYVGGQIGYAWGQDPVTWSGISNDDELAAGTFSHTPQGVIGGAHVGYNLQYNQWLVLGIEGTVDGTSLRHTAVVPVNDFFGETPGSLTATSRADVQGSVRGRIGITFDRVLIYGTGGVAFTGFNTTITDTTGFFTGVPGTSATFSNTRAGWTAGGGIEYAVTDNWWVRAEYRYSNFGHTTDFPFIGELPFSNSFVFLQRHPTENQVQAGFSYRFDWTAPQPAVAVVAKLIVAFRSRINHVSQSFSGSRRRIRRSGHLRWHQSDRSVIRP